MEVFQEVRRVLADHGSLWLNLGDSYATQSGKSANVPQAKHLSNSYPDSASHRSGNIDGLKPKDLCGVPWRVAFSLQDDGWWLRSDIIWEKLNAMPSSATDRPTNSHEYIFMLTKKSRYYFDQEAVREPYTAPLERWGGENVDGYDQSPRGLDRERSLRPNPAGRNVRSVWTFATDNFGGAHFAVFPEELVRRCIFAGCPTEVCNECGEPRVRIVESTKTFQSGSGRSDNPIHGKQDLSGSKNNSTPDIRMGPVVHTTTIGWSDCGHGNYRRGIVLDIFMGSGTTALVARKHDRHSVGIELNSDYCAIAAQRLQQLSLLTEVM